MPSKYGYLLCSEYNLNYATHWQLQSCSNSYCTSPTQLQFWHQRKPHHVGLPKFPAFIFFAYLFSASLCALRFTWSLPSLTSRARSLMDKNHLRSYTILTEEFCQSMDHHITLTACDLHHLQLGAHEWPCTLNESQSFVICLCKAK